MGFHVVYVAGGELDKVKRVNYVDRIHNFAYLEQPYNKMVSENIPAKLGIYDIEYTSPDEECELISVVVTCSGYGENDYYNIWINNQLWFDTWFPTEVKEGLYIGTSTYAYKLPPNTPFLLRFVNMSGTAKKVWFGIRMIRNPKTADNFDVELVDVTKVAMPSATIDPNTTTWIQTFNGSTSSQASPTNPLG